MLSISFDGNQLSRYFHTFVHDSVRKNNTVIAIWALKGPENKKIYCKHVSNHLWNNFKPKMSTNVTVFKLFKERYCKKKWEGNKYRDKESVCDSQKYMLIMKTSIFFFSDVTDLLNESHYYDLRNFSCGLTLSSSDHLYVCSWEAELHLWYYISKGSYDLFWMTSSIMIES